MNILFYSDQHLGLGPREPIRPEMRRLSDRFGERGRLHMEHFEDRLREEAKKVRQIAGEWMEKHADGYDLLINGGDIAMPLARHEDRLEAARTVWTQERDRYGEERYIALTGNHELGHGYEVDPEGFADFLELRRELFDGEINHRGYGVLKAADGHIVFVDSEIIRLYDLRPYEPLIQEHLVRMSNMIRDVVQQSGPIAIYTHNTARTRHWIRRKLGVWADLVGQGRQVLIIGGHFHIPRITHRDGAEVHWSGGGSYPEPWLRYLVRVPFTGIQRGGPGAIELTPLPGRYRIRHKPFGLPLPLFKRMYERRKASAPSS